MANITPTFRGLRWGPERWQMFDYKAHPIRDVGGNPCLVWRHGGAGWGGNLSDCWLSTEPYNPFFEYLLDASRAVHFDIVSIETGQQVFLNPAGNIPQVDANTTPTGLPPTKRLYMTDSVIDYKHGIASMKRVLQGVNNQTAYFVNPDKIVAGGWSHGSTLAVLASLTDTIKLAPSREAFWKSNLQTKTFDSKVLGVIAAWSQIDIRRRSLTDTGGTSVRNYLDITTGWGAAWWGSRPGNLDAGAEWTAQVPAWWKEAMSILYYLETGKTENYVPLFTTYGDNVGNHLFPLVDVHDSRQRTDLNDALRAAGVPFQTGTTRAAISGFFEDYNSSQLYDWMRGLVAESSKRVMTGAVR